jgi:hypothetical protein
MAEERNNPTPKHEPPHWLQVGDESWGQTDVRKRKPRPLSRPALPPRLPYPNSGSKLPFRELLIFLVVIAVNLAGAIWLQKLVRTESSFLLVVGMFAALFLELGVFIIVLWLRKVIRGKR